jgi:hypothetical protein
MSPTIKNTEATMKRTPQRGMLHPIFFSQIISKLQPRTRYVVSDAKSQPQQTKQDTSRNHKRVLRQLVQGPTQLVFAKVAHVSTASLKASKVENLRQRYPKRPASHTKFLQKTNRNSFVSSRTKPHFPSHRKRDT